MASTEGDSASDRADLAALAERLGHVFADPALLTRALTHSSVGDGNTDKARADNERLEFLGDRVLGLVVADLLCRRFPQEREGALASRHAWLVSRDALAEVSADLELGRRLVLSRGEEEGGGRDNPALLANACEAVIAALYLDGGLEAARRFIEKAWESLVEADRKPPRDAKTLLQEWAQGRGLPLPSYTVTQREGPAHEPRFTVEARVAGEPAAEGRGRSKRAAEQEAAGRILERLYGSSA